MSDRAPEVPRRQAPTPDGSRPESAPAWQAAWDLLATGKAYPRTDIIRMMRDASPISFRTARELLILAVSDGSLVVTERDAFGRPTLKRADR